MESQTAPVSPNFEYKRPDRSSRRQSTLSSVPTPMPYQYGVLAALAGSHALTLTLAFTRAVRPNVQQAAVYDDEHDGAPEPDARRHQHAHLARAQPRAVLAPADARPGPSDQLPPSAAAVPLRLAAAAASADIVAADEPFGGRARRGCSPLAGAAPAQRAAAVAALADAGELEPRDGRHPWGAGRRRDAGGAERRGGRCGFDGLQYDCGGEQ
ncbi:hypothetical protein EVJ58_g2707 [Rhodofomes roseus]|uniref:Uncharacterized protein n=1 Tax=Rhodofomes roseus TaxID=34475 RepID=A0A4Y9YP17_9APHY|nr:hypothetical protein EVJ58_g2707 [Rhodofomes roseus]